MKAPRLKAAATRADAKMPAHGAASSAPNAKSVTVDPVGVSNC